MGIVHGTMGNEKFEVDGGKCMSDLYVSDLDGTLLRISQNVKDFWHAENLDVKALW